MVFRTAWRLRTPSRSIRICWRSSRRDRANADTQDGGRERSLQPPPWQHEPTQLDRHQYSAYRSSTRQWPPLVEVLVGNASAFVSLNAPVDCDRTVIGEA